MTHIIVGAGQAGGWAAIGMRQARFRRPHPVDRRRNLAAVRASATFQGGADRGGGTADDVFPYRRNAMTSSGSNCCWASRSAELDPQAHRVRLSDGRDLDYDRLLLTIGGRLAHLPIPGR